MKTLKLATLVGASLALFVGCDTVVDDTSCDTFDTGCDVGTETDTAPLTLTITDFTWSCNNPDNDPQTWDGDWTYYVKTEAWASSATLDIKETGSTQPWDETIDLSQIAFDPDGAWDEWGATLAETSQTSAVDNTHTLYRCGYHSSDSLTWMAAVYGEGGVLADCVVTGHDVTAFDGQGPGGANCFSGN